MKKIFQAVCFLALVTFAFSSCKSNDFDFEKAKEEQRIKDSIELARIEKIIAQQAPELEAFARQHFTNPVFDDSTGMWFEILAPGDDNSYSYTVNNYGIVAPTVTVAYKGTLLDGKVFDETGLNEKGEEVTREFNLGETIKAWHWAFLPKSFKVNGQEINTLGITAKGLKKGSKTRFVTPSPWAYDTSSRKDKDGVVIIPANSPLYFEIDVKAIK